MTCWMHADLLWQSKQKIAAHLTSVTPELTVAGASSWIRQRQTNNNQEIKTSNSYILRFCDYQVQRKQKQRGKTVSCCQNWVFSHVSGWWNTRTWLCYFFLVSPLPRDSRSTAGRKIKKTSIWFLSLMLICLFLALTNNYLVLSWQQGEKMTCYSSVECFSMISALLSLLDLC